MSWRVVADCGRKVRFAYKAEAKRRHPRLRAYRCPFCDGFHVASKVAQRRRAA